MAEVDSGIDDPDDRALPRRAREFVAVAPLAQTRGADLRHRRRGVLELLGELHLAHTGKRANLPQSLDRNARRHPFADPDAKLASEPDESVLHSRRPANEHVGGDGAGLVTRERDARAPG